MVVDEVGSQDSWEVRPQSRMGFLVFVGCGRQEIARLGTYANTSTTAAMEGMFDGSIAREREMIESLGK